MRPPGIEVYEASQSVLEGFTEYVETAKFHEATTTGGIMAYRTGAQHHIAPGAKFADSLLEDAGRVIAAYAERWPIYTTRLEGFNVLRYTENQEYKYHVDSTAENPRIVSALCYINDDYVGGELDFSRLEYTYKPKAGEWVLFGSSYIFEHASVPVESGVKYAINCFFK
jgi:hypothetical protein